jgi:hypothetical protein
MPLTVETLKERQEISGIRLQELLLEGKKCQGTTLAVPLTNPIKIRGFSPRGFAVLKGYDFSRVKCSNQN